MVKRIVFLLGLLLCSYPLISNVVVQKEQQDVVTTYQNQVKMLDDNQVKARLEEAYKYNSGIVTNDYQGDYQVLLNPAGDGVMGSIEIPKINVNLPIYHGTEDETLAKGIGHIYGSSLPVGGEDTHCLLAGHRGLPDSQLLTRLHELEVGDLFNVKVYNQILTYEVCEIRIIKPEDVAVLTIQPGRDLISLITCTPYGINTYRLVVTGERTEGNEGL